MFDSPYVQIAVYAIAAAQCLVSGVIYLFIKGDRAPLRPRLLAGLFCLIAIVLLDMALERTTLYHHYPQFGNIGKMLATALPGLVYLYARTTYLQGFRLRWYDAFHTLPLLLKGGTALFAYHLQPAAVQLTYWQGGWRSHPINWPWLSTLVIGIYVAQLAMLARLVRRHRKAMLQVRSNTLDRSYRLLQVFVGAYGVQLILNTSRAFFMQIEAFDAMQVVTTFMGLWIYVVVTLLIVDLIVGSDRRNALSEEEARIGGFGGPHSAPRPMATESEHWARLDDQLESYMQSRKPHLDPNLTLVQLARRIGVPGRELSGYINTRLGCNFSDYIAGRRIAEAKDMLRDDSQPITQVIYACGFNSKSVFNSHFKKRTGMTPSEWRDAPAA